MADEIRGGINLLPRLTKGELVQEKRKGTLIMGTAVITFLVSLGSVLLLGFNLYQSYMLTGVNLPFLETAGLEPKIVELETQAEQFREVLSAHTELATKVDFVKDILLGRPDYQQTLDRVQALLPEEIEVRGYEISESNEIRLMGQAKDYYTLAIFINRAQKPNLTQGYFENFLLERASLREGQVDFSITAYAVFPEDKEMTF